MKRLLATSSVILAATTSGAFAQSEILVTDTDRILRFETTTLGAWPLIDAFVGDAIGTLDNAKGMAYGPDGRLYVASYDNDRILVYDGQSGQPADAPFVAVGAGGLDGPHGIAWGPNGNLYVCSYNTDAVIEYDGITGTPIGPFVLPGSAGLDGPWDLGFGPDGHLYVSGYLSNTINVYDGSTGDPIGDGVFADSTSGGTLDGPSGIAFGPDDDLFVAEYDDDTVIRFNGTTGEYIGVFASGNGIDAPTDIEFGPTDGHLYVTDISVGDQILKFDGTFGFFIEEVVTGLSNPYFLLFKPDQCAQDLDGSGAIDFGDIIDVLANWGPCLP